MAALLKEPGVEVEQKFVTQSPTTVVPVLVPLVLGACFQFVDLYTSTSGAATLNSDALVQLPASLFATPATGDPAAYSGLDGEDVVLSINNGPDVTITLSGASISPASLVSQLRAGFLAEEMTEATAEQVGDGFRIRTYGKGPFETIEVKAGTGATVLSTFGWTVGHVYTGLDALTPSRVVVPTKDLPDPRGNIDSLVFDTTMTRVFLSTGGGVLRELSKTEAFLRKGGTGTAASVEGTVLLSTVGLYGGGGLLDGLRLNVLVDGTTTVVNLGTPADAEDLLQKINAAIGKYVATEGAAGLKITSTTKGSSSVVTIVADGTPALDAKGVLGFSSANDTSTGLAGVRVIDDGNGDVLSPLVKVQGESFSAAGTVATYVGNVDLTGLVYPGGLSGMTLTLRANGFAPQTLTFGTVANAAAVAAAVDTFFSSVGVVGSLSGNFLQLATDPTFPLGEDAFIEVVGGTAAAALGLTASLSGARDLTALYPDPTVLNAKKFKIGVGTSSAEVTFSGLLIASTPADIAAQLNGDSGFAAIARASISTNLLVIHAKQAGKDATLAVLPASSAEAATYLGFTPGTSVLKARVSGTAHPPLPGDDFYIDGTLAGRITQVAVAGDAAVLRMNKQFALNTNLGSKYTIRARGLSVSSSTRPTPELVIGGDGSATLKDGLLRDVYGDVLLSSSALIYTTYKALRKDVSQAASSPSLLLFTSTEEVESLVGPINTSNPLAFGLYMALINAPGTQVAALGVDDFSADAPEGTEAAFIRGLEFLESQNVYAIAPMTQNQTVAEAVNAHVSAMSAPDQKSERIAFINLAFPSKKQDAVVVSGLGNTVGALGTQFDTGAAGLSQLLLAAGVASGAVPASTGLFLDIGRDGKRYSVSNVSGSVVTIRTTFSAGENDDGFFATTDLNDSPLPSLLVNEAFALKLRGVSLTRADGSPDKDGIAETIANTGALFQNRRLRVMGPDSIGVSVNGLEQRVPGYFRCAARIGMVAKQSPSQSFTNFPEVGITRVYNSNDFFSKKQLNVISSGGIDMAIQPTAGGPILSRYALTTDLTSVETRTDSITVAIDYLSILMRTALRNFIGKYNITTGFLDGLGNVAQAVLEFAVGAGIIAQGSLLQLLQDENNPDTVLVSVRVRPLYPCNNIKVTIEV